MSNYETMVLGMWKNEFTRSLVEKPWWVALQETEFSQMVDFPDPHGFDLWAAFFTWCGYELAPDVEIKHHVRTEYINVPCTVPNQPVLDNLPEYTVSLKGGHHGKKESLEK